jgi:threonyl-tRNA synthetase
MKPEDKIYKIRHSLAHLLASVVEKDYAGAKFTIGPAVENGFYYDIDFKNSDKKVSDENLVDLTQKMQTLAKSNLEFSHKVVSKEEALEIFKNNQYKKELIEEIAAKGETITIYTVGDFVDLCRGGHVENTSEIDPESFELTHLAGAYWRGDEKNAMLTRVYGLAFETKDELEKYKFQMEEAKKRDHRVLGKELGLFIFSPLVGPGLPLWTPKGTILRKKVDEYVQTLRKKYNYGAVTIPHITKNDLYKKSGHWEKYAEDLYKIDTRDGHTLCMKPMNCPHHTQLFASEMRSYRELPIRYSETTMVYRDEQSGELSGLSRVLSITQDDAHVFCRESQLEEEMNNIWDLIETFYKTFGFTDLTPRFSRRDSDSKFKGGDEIWKKAEDAIKSLLEKRVSGKWIDGAGEAAFYGPKIDFMAKDAIGRNHQVATIQLDFVQPANLELEYINEEGKKDQPVMIHCAIAGSLERFLSVYLEHSAGKFPFWLAPEQVRVLTISDKISDYTTKIKSTLENFVLNEPIKYNELRFTIDDRSENIGKKIREAKLEKIPVIIVIGPKDMDAGTLSVTYGDEEKKVNLSDLESFLKGL